MSEVVDFGSVATATSRSFWPSVGSRWITSPSGDGSSGTLRNWSGACAGTSSRPTTRGGLTRRTCGVKGKWVYLYRAVDSSGATIDFLLLAKPDTATAKRFLSIALGGENHPEPRGHQQRQARRLSTRHCRAPSRRRFGRQQPTPPRAVSQ